MDNKVTFWKPDTCDCEISYSWDTTLPIALRVHTGFCVGIKEDADRLALRGDEGVCAAHSVIDLARNEKFPHFKRDLERLDWHIRRASPLHTIVERENVAVNTMRQAVARMIPELRKTDGPEDELADVAVMPYTFSGVGADRTVSVGLAPRSLTAAERRALRDAAAEASAKLIPVTFAG
jgi:hypothetical protein